jgi:uncharacterized protein YbcV (DUF1398 family)
MTGAKHKSSLFYTELKNTTICGEILYLVPKSVHTCGEKDRHQ